MREIIGNMWDYPAEYKCITTNGVVDRNGRLVMGAGNALEAATRFPNLPKELGLLVKNYGNEPYIFKDYGIISFPTKQHWAKPSIPALISASARRLREIVDKSHINSVVIPRPGCGYGKLNWADVKPLLEPHFDVRFLVISHKDSHLTQPTRRK